MLMLKILIVGARHVEGPAKMLDFEPIVRAREQYERVPKVYGTSHVQGRGKAGRIQAGMHDFVVFVPLSAQNRS